MLVVSPATMVPGVCEGGGKLGQCVFLVIFALTFIFASFAAEIPDFAVPSVFAVVAGGWRPWDAFCILDLVTCRVGSALGDLLERG